MIFAGIFYVHILIQNRIEGAWPQAAHPLSLVSHITQPPAPFCSPVDHRVALHSAQEQVLVVVFGLADGVSMSGKVADSFDKAVAIPDHVGEVRGLPVPGLHVVQHPQVILALNVRQIERDGEELLHELHDLLIGEPDLGQSVDATTQLARTSRQGRPHGHGALRFQCA